jgi:hypothetical protein
LEIVPQSAEAGIASVAKHGRSQRRPGFVLTTQQTASLRQPLEQFGIIRVDLDRPAQVAQSVT